MKELPEVESDQNRRTPTKLPTTYLDGPIDNAGKFQEIKKAKDIPKFVVIEMTLDVPIDGSEGSGQIESRIQLPSKNMRNIDELMIEIELEATVVRNVKWTIAEKK